MRAPLTFLAIASIVFVALAVECGPSGVRAESECALTLSRVVISEAGYNPGRELHAILAVLEWRRTHMPALLGLSLTRMSTRYAAEFNGRARTRRAAESRRLTWSQIPDAIEADVRAWIRGERQPSPCGENVTDWASPAFVRAQGLTPIRCEIETQNAFVRRR